MKEDTTMKRFIKSSTEFDDTKEVEVTVEAGEIIDVSADPEDTSYTVDSYEDYEYFMNHVKI
jgi:hypothetical protein